jgi:hypothetical protein
VSNKNRTEKFRVYSASMGGYSPLFAVGYGRWKNFGKGVLELRVRTPHQANKNIMSDTNQISEDQFALRASASLRLNSVLICVHLWLKSKNGKEKVKFR